MGDDPSNPSDSDPNKPNNGSEVDIAINKENNKDKNPTGSNDGGWKICVMSRTERERKKYCDGEFNNPLYQNKCQKNFCTECCEAKIDPIYKNIIHVCKKTCFKATVASSNNDEYKNI